MNQVFRNQASEAKNIIYPEHIKKKNDKNFHKKNLNDLKKLQSDQREKKYEEENHIKPEPYKMKQFKNIQSKVGHQIIHSKTIDPNSVSKKREQSVGFSNKNSLRLPNPNEYQSKPKEQTNIQKKENLFDEEVQVFIHKNNNQLPSEEQILGNLRKNKMNSSNNVNSNYVIAANPQNNNYNNYNLDRQDSNDNEDLDKLKRENELLQQKLNELNKEEENYNSYNNDDPTNKMLSQTNKGGSKRNYIAENKNKINEIQPKSNKIEQESTIHKNYGKVPNYIQKYKSEKEEKKQMEKKIAEESKFPKGTRLLSEEERLSTLASLQDTRKDLSNMLEKMPISMKTMAMMNRKTELEKKLNEIEEAIKTFSRKQVFIKSDD